MSNVPKLLRKARAKLARGTQPEKELSAYHEAAHAVVAWAQGVEVSHVHIDADKAAEVDASLVAATARETGTWIENARICIAGRLADSEIEEPLGVELVFDAAGGEHNDEASFKYNLLYAAGRDEQRARELLEPTLEETGRILAQHRRQHLLLANELYRRGSLDTPEIEKILGPLPKVTDETAAERQAVKEMLQPAKGSGVGIWARMRRLISAGT